MYAQLCKRLAEHAPNLEPPDSKVRPEGVKTLEHLAPCYTHCSFILVDLLTLPLLPRLPHLNDCCLTNARMSSRIEQAFPQVINPIYQNGKSNSRPSAYEKRAASLTEEEKSAKFMAKRKMLGNIKFIAELGKVEMLHDSILHRCAEQLLVRIGFLSTRNLYFLPTSPGFLRPSDLGLLVLSLPSLTLEGVCDASVLHLANGLCPSLYSACIARSYL